MKIYTTQADFYISNNKHRKQQGQNFRPSFCSSKDLFIHEKKTSKSLFETIQAFIIGKIKAINPNYETKQEKIEKLTEIFNQRNSLYPDETISKENFERLFDFDFYNYNILKEILIIPERKKQLNIYEIQRISRLSLNKYEKVKERQLLFGTKDKQINLSGYDIVEISCMKTREWDKIKSHIFNGIENRECNLDEALAFEKLNDTQKKRAKKIYHLPYKDQLSLSSIYEFVTFDDKKWKKIEKLTSTKEPIHELFIKKFIKLAPKEWQRINFMLDNKSFDKQGTLTSVDDLLQMDNKHWNRTKSIILAMQDGKNEKLDLFWNRDLVKLKDKEWNFAKNLLYIPERTEQFSYYDIKSYSETKKNREIISTILNTPERIDTPAHALNDILKIDKESWEKAKELLYIKGREKQLLLPDILRITKLSDEYWIKAKELAINSELSAGAIYQISKFDNDQWLRYKERNLSKLKILNEHKLRPEDYSVFTQLDDETWEIAKTIINHPNRKTYISCFTIAELALNTKLYKRIEDRKLLEKFKPLEREMYDKEILALGNLTDEEWNNIEKRQITNKINSGIGGKDIANLAKINEKTWKKTHALLIDNTVNINSPSISTLITISDLPKREYENAMLLLKTQRVHSFFNNDDLLKLVHLNKEILEEVIDKNLYSNIKADSILLYDAFKEYKKITDISQLDKEEKKSLLNKLIYYNSRLFDEDFHKLMGNSIIPRFKTDYCTLLPRLSSEITIIPTKLSQKQQTEFFNALKELEEYKEFIEADLDDNFNVSQTYQRESFINDVKKLLSKSTKKITEKFGFSIINNKLVGYPKLPDDELNLQEQELYNIVDKYINKNGITIDKNPKLESILTSILNAFPELRTIIGKKQHPTHHYTVDLHTLKVLQDVMRNSRYKDLPENDRRILQIATLFHDLTKIEEEIDKTHPTNSSFDAYNILQKLDYDENSLSKIYAIIKNHDWLERYNVDNIVSQEQISKEIAFELRQNNCFEMASILCEADLKGVQKDDVFYHKFKDALSIGNTEISKLVNNLQKTTILLPLSKLPKASDLKADGEFVTCETVKGVTNKYIHMDKIPESFPLKNIGFSEDTCKSELIMLLHGLNSGQSSAIFDVLGHIDSNAVLSTSLYNDIDSERRLTYHQDGFIVDVLSDDIHVAYCESFASGYEKNTDNLINTYLFNGSGEKYRNYYPNLIMKKLRKTNNSYKNTYSKYANKSFAEIKKENPVLASGIDSTLKTFKKDGKNFSIYSEILISRPKIKGVFSYSGKYKDLIPDYLREYANQHDLPIYLLK